MTLKGVLKGLLTTLSIFALIIGAVLTAIAFTPMPNGKNNFQTNMPSNSPNPIENLNSDGKNMAIAGIVLIVCGFLGACVRIRIG